MLLRGNWFNIRITIRLDEGFQEEDHGSAIFIVVDQDNTGSAGFFTAHVDLDHMVEGMFTGIFPCEVILPPCPPH